MAIAVMVTVMRTMKLLTVTAWVSVACGPVADLDGDDAGATAGPATGTTDTGSADGVDGSGSVGGDACQWMPQQLPGVFDPAPECIDLVSRDEVAPFTLRIINQGAEIQYLTGPSACIGSYFRLTDSQGNAYPSVGCTWSCEGALEGYCGCLANCPQPQTVAIFPGGTFEVEWEGWVWGLPREASEACAGGCAGPCSLRIPPADGMAQVSLGLATDLECGEQCECQPNAAGWCEVPGGWPLGGESVERAVTWPPTCPLLEVYL